jgi:hypothetical protein
LYLSCTKIVRSVFLRKVLLIHNFFFLIAKPVLAMRTTTLLLFVLFLSAGSAWAQVMPRGTTSSGRVDTLVEIKTDTTVTKSKPSHVRSQRIRFPNSSLSSVDVRLGWSVLSDDGTFLQNPLRYNNWENVTLRPLPASFSIHFPYFAKSNGAMGQIGFQTFYSASKAPWIGGERNFGTAHFYGANVDFRSIFPTIEIDRARFNPFVNYGLGYTYRSVALYNHEPIVHFGGGLTSWITDRLGITVSGTGNFGTLHLIDGYTSYLQGNIYFLYRF